MMMIIMTRRFFVPMLTENEVNLTTYSLDANLDLNITGLDALMLNDNDTASWSTLPPVTTTTTTSTVTTTLVTAVMTFRSPVRLPVVPHHHHGPRWGPYFEDGVEEHNVTARVGTTVRLDCKIGMLHDKTVSFYFVLLGEE
jgi:hypothetical protein